MSANIIAMVMAGMACFSELSLAQSRSITNDLVVHLTFDKHYQNAAPSGVKATPVGAPTFGPGRVGSHALAFSSFEGRYNYVTLGTPPELNFGSSTDFSVAFWIKFALWDGNPAFVSNKDWIGIGPPGWVIATSRPGGIQWNLRESDGNEVHYFGPDGKLGGGVWHHLAVAFDRGGVGSAYLDGILVNETPIGAGLPSLDTRPGLATNIGQDGTGSNSNVSINDGVIDDVGIWRRALSAEEVKRIYEGNLKGISISDLDKQVVPPPVPLITRISIDGANVVLAWTNSVGAVTVQRRAAVAGTNWTNVATSTNRTARLPIEGTAAFFRIAVNP